MYKAMSHSTLSFESIEESIWNETYQKLLEFWLTRGHCNVHQQPPDLADWVERQQLFRDHLSRRQIDLLDEINFEWNKSPGIDQLQKGNNTILQSTTGNQRQAKLGTTTTKQARQTLLDRTFQQPHYYQNENIDPMQECTNIWSPHSDSNISKSAGQPQQDASFDSVLVDDDDSSTQPLATFLPSPNPQSMDECVVSDDESDVDQDIVPDLDLTLSDPPNNNNNNNNTASGDDYQPKLSRFDQKWNEMYHRLVQFKHENGHCRCSSLQDEQLAGWIRTQRVSYSKKRLSDPRRDKLNGLGFVWRMHDTKNNKAQRQYESERHQQLWDDMFARLQQYYRQHGHVDVPTRYKNEPRLGIWVDNVRLRYKSGTLDAKRIASLNAMDFSWEKKPGNNIYDMNWQATFERLVNYKREHGDCNVPVSYEPDPKLARWVAVQRSFWNTGRMNPTRKVALDDLGFCWKPRERGRAVWNWDEMLDRLRNFKEEFGHCAIGLKYRDPFNLASWAHRQRFLYKNRGLRKERVNALNEIGFIWSLHEYNRKRKGDAAENPPKRNRKNRTFDESLRLLKQFKEAFGHTIVPSNYKDDTYLGRWVMNQRYLYGKGRLEVERIAALDNLGFVWRLKERSRDEQR